MQVQEVVRPVRTHSHHTFAHWLITAVIRHHQDPAQALPALVVAYRARVARRVRVVRPLDAALAFSSLWVLALTPLLVTLRTRRAKARVQVRAAPHPPKRAYITVC